MVNITDVALAAGFSRGTASNAFTHPELVSEALRERVLAAANELGYGGPKPPRLAIVRLATSSDCLSGVHVSLRSTNST